MRGAPAARSTAQGSASGPLGAIVQEWQRTCPLGHVCLWPPGIWLALPHPGDKEPGGALSNWPFEMYVSHPPEGPLPAPQSPPPPRREGGQSLAAECLLTTGCHQHRPGFPTSTKNSSRGQKWYTKPEAGFEQRRRLHSGGRPVMDLGLR